jgi:nucleotide-binding universal stress UspA family protein
MKMLLVLTDFTSNASHAEGAAIKLSAKLGTGIMLYHTMPYIPLIPSDSGSPYVNETESIITEDNKELLIQEADKLREIAVITQQGQIHIETAYGEGGLGDIIADVSDDQEIKMVIMGGRSGSTIEHLLNGSDTANVIRKSRKPVLVIPATLQWDIPQKIVFATDFGETDMQAVEFLINLTELLNAQLNILHVFQPDKEVSDLGPEIAFRRFIDHNNITYEEVVEEDVHIGLENYCRANGFGLLAMVHGHHSFIGRLFGHSESRALIADQLLPVIVFPPDFKYTLL